MARGIGSRRGLGWRRKSGSPLTERVLVRTGVLAAVATLAGSAIGAGTAAAASVGGAAFTLDTSLPAVVASSGTVNGVPTTAWHFNGHSVTVAGTDVASVTLAADAFTSQTAGVSVQLDTATPGARVLSVPSQGLYNTALAAGAPASVAQQLAAQSSAAPLISNGPIGYTCVRLGGGSKIYYTCDNNWIGANPHPGEYIYGDSMEGTGTDPNGILHEESYITYSGGTTLVHWDPNGPVSGGACHTQGFNVSGFGFGVGTSTTLCNGTLYVVLPWNWEYGTQWKDTDGPDSQAGTGSADQFDKHPANPSPNVVFHADWGYY